MSILRVALDIPLPRLFDYRVEGDVTATADDIGRCVRVPFGRGEKTGIIVDVVAHSDQPAEKLKPAGEIFRQLPPLPPDWLALSEFCSRYYQHPLGEVMALALPPYLRRGKLPAPRKEKPPAEIPAPVLPELLAEQAQAVAAIAASFGRYGAFLLHGITGSGKTEVYLRLIAETLAQGKQALMLVPEIALTPQLEGRVAARFPHARIVSAHSGLAEAARARGFIAALEGRVDILLGTRLAVFAPLPRLGLIVVDEEHDASFKQQEGLRYSARDVAVWRAHQRQLPIVLGSATPSLESFHHARADGGRYRYIELTRRAVAEAPPDVRCIDTRREKLQDGMSAALLAAIAERLERGEQSLVFLNRRGYAPVLACPACGWVSRCRRCAANLVVHLADKRLRCHHCGLETTIPRNCPTCGNLDIHAFGRGTQRLEEHLATRFSAARILRVDRDSANTPAKWRSVLETIHDGRADILIGTQMLAKGHDFPRLTLVGAVGADAALFAADFRAPERLFSQLMQVGGRSGRASLPGEVLIQTEYPQHPLYQALVAHDYASFAHGQLEERRQAGFPPFTFQAMLRAEAHRLDDALGFLKEAASLANAQLPGGVSLYDPVPMRMYRVMALERAQLLVESASRPALQAFLPNWIAQLQALKTPRQLRWHLDVDPLEF
ncbi:Primosomal protein N [Sterolibacterium denitrificans]|uniref:Replication restart protein PriA n=2 Tax=Sterolibacterium denitrificans TaxID=157592 RepID=A0A656Z6M1_9PROT|nr:primosomal protein N' [Sterolibacterium denitrificans]KYC28839.1 primosomal protein DnaI [Sterolibacterium denitrificans]SMB21179.1 Primosomal protein N [Sterolibacterium denitrificans]